MIEKYKKSQHSKRQIVLFAVSIFAIFCIVVSVGKYISFPWVLGITTENIVSEKIGDSYGVIVDQGGDRLSYLDANKNVVDVKAPYSTEGNLFFYSSVDFNDSAVFVVEYCYHGDSHFIKQEKIVQYNTKGEKVADLKTYSYDLTDNYTNVSRIKAMSLSDEKLFYTYYDSLHNTYSINSINLNSGEVVQETALMQAFPNPCSIPALYSIGYDCQNNQLNVFDSFGNIYIAYSGDSDFEEASQNFINQSNSDGTNSVIETYSFFFKGEVLQNGDTCSYSFLLSLRIICFWLALAYFVVAAIVLIALFIKKNKSKNVIKKLKVPIIICVACAVAIGVVICINSYSKDMQFNSQEETITQNVLFVSNAGYEEFLNLINTDINSSEYKSNYEKAMVKLQRSSLLSARSDLGSSFSLYKLDGGKWQLLANSSSPSISGIYDSHFNPENSVPDEYGVIRSTSSNPTGNYRYAAIYIYDSSNNIVGALNCFRNIDTGNNEIQSGTIMLMMGIASALIAISLLLMEGLAWIKLFIKRRKKDKPNRQSPELSITRPLFCLMAAVSSADATIGVLIFQDMLVGTPFEGNALLISFPLTCKVLGNIIGIPFFVPLTKKFKTKPLLLISVVCAILCYVFCAFSVSFSKIFILCIGLLFANFFKQIIWMYLDDVPTHITDGRKRKELNNNCVASTVCGSALVTIVVGYATVAFGDWIVYICGAFILIIIFIIVLFLIPKRTVLDLANENKQIEKKKNSIKEILKFIFRIDVITLILSAFAIGILISGYKSFIFPLIADMNGMSKADISNISVFSNALVFYITPLFTAIQKDLGTNKILIFTELIVGVMFVLFFYNNSFIWACFVYFVVQMLRSFIATGSSDCWQGIAIKSKSDTNIALTSIMTADKILDLSKNTIMGALMGFGSVIACVIIGIYCIVTTAIFGFFSKKNKTE